MSQFEITRDVFLYPQIETPIVFDSIVSNTSGCASYDVKSQSYRVHSPGLYNVIASVSIQSDFEASSLLNARISDAIHKAAERLIPVRDLNDLVASYAYYDYAQSATVHLTPFLGERPGTAEISVAEQYLTMTVNRIISLVPTEPIRFKMQSSECARIIAKDHASILTIVRMDS